MPIKVRSTKYYDLIEVKGLKQFNAFDYVIPGIMCKKEIDENLQAQKIKQISKKDLKRILEVYNKNEKKIFIKNKKK